MNCEHCGKQAMRGLIICKRCREIFMTDLAPPVPARWYCMASNGLATLCANEHDARTMAEECDASWPKNAPHRAVLLGDVSAERERCAMICEKAEGVAWSLWATRADPAYHGAARKAEELANEIRLKCEG